MTDFSLASYTNHFSYLGIYLWFSILEQFTPIPEEVSLASVGYIARQANLNYIICGVVSLAGLLSTDMFLFYIALKGNKISAKLLDKINPKILDKVKEQLQAKPKRTIIIMALLPKLRFLSPIVCGTVGIPLRLFFLLNLIATACYTVFYMLIGILFYSELNRILHKLSLVQHSIFILLMLIVTVFIVLKLRKSIMRTKDA